MDYAAKFLELHYFGNLDILNLEEKEKKNFDKTQLRGYKNGAFETYEMRKVDDWDYRQVIEHPKLGGFVSERDPQDLVNKGKRESEKTSNETKRSKKSSSSGIACKECGAMMDIIKANCYECTNCNNQIGGCG